ncbi:A-kinase anchor protein 18 [Sarotherodon galilaeus]
MSAKVGRKRQSPIWDYFEYDCVLDKSKCLVVERDKICGTFLKGKNPTNLKLTLRRVREHAQASSPETEANSRQGSCFQRRPDGCWLVNSQEHHKREEALVNMFIETGISTLLCESIAFKKFSNSLEPKFQTPGAARVNSLIGAKMDIPKQKLKELIKEARKLTLCVDGWSKRGLRASFMGVHHALLNLHRLEHLHTGEAIARCIDQTLEKWAVGKEKVLLVVTDNGANIVKAVQLLQNRRRTDDTNSSQDEQRAAGEGQNEIKFHRMPCLAHTLQLTIKDAIKHPTADSVITKARKLVHAVRKSSVANEEMIKRCGKTLIRDCTTRWNSTFDMLRRLLETRAELNQLLEQLEMDTLLTSDWTKMENLVKLFEPFAIHTDQLQSDSQSLSQVVPCLLNLEAHLLTSPFRNPLAQVLLKSLGERFAGILNPDSTQFDATPAGACLLDSNVSLILQSPDTAPLMKAAKSFVQNLAAQYNPGTTSQDDVNTAEPTETVTGVPPSVLQKYRFLASRIELNLSCPNPDGLFTEVEKYITEVKQGAVYPKLAPVALDLVSAPASQAFVERIFSVCGLLSSGLRNRTTTSLEQRVFLKINKKLLLD